MKQASFPLALIGRKEAFSLFEKIVTFFNGHMRISALDKQEI